MGAFLIRSRAMLTRPTSPRDWEEIADGALLVEDGIIAAIGSFEALQRQHPTLPVTGTGREVALPGFVNAHHHVGMTPVQLGSPDMPLELWFVTRMVMKAVNYRLDTLYSAFEMIASGVTTVQHIHGWVPGTQNEVMARCNEVIAAYEEIGMRVSYCLALRDQNRLVYRADEEFLASLPEELRGPMARWYARLKLTLEENCDVFRGLHAQHAGKRRVRVQLAPANLHWCSDAALTALADLSRDYDAPMHIHLLETAYQKEYARRRTGGGTALDHLARFGMLGPNLTLGHGVWLSEREIETVAATGTCICHNCSSNFRLRSGVAPLNRWEEAGITTAIGIDEAGINDDRDMLQEMRLVLRAHRVPGMEEADVPATGQVLRMATVGGARTTPWRDGLGTLEVGKPADLSLIDWNGVAWPYLDPLTSTLDAVILRAKSGAVRTVLCDGEAIYQDGRFTRVDRDAALQALHQDLTRALHDDEAERRRLSAALLPHVRRFYADWIDPARHEPYYRPSSRM